MDVCTVISQDTMRCSKCGAEHLITVERPSLNEFIAMPTEAKQNILKKTELQCIFCGRGFFVLGNVLKIR